MTYENSKILYKCPFCGESVTFQQKVTVLNTFNSLGELINQEVIKEGKKITCGLCGSSDLEELFKVG